MNWVVSKMKIFVSLTFDDGSQNYFTRFRPILEKFGFKATFYIITSQMGLANRMNWKQINTLYQQGHEIGSHTHTHHSLIELSDKQLDFELSESKKKLARFDVSTFSYPFGDYDKRVINFTKKYYTAARTCGDLEGHEKDLGLNIEGLNLFALKTTTFPLLQKAKKSEDKSWVILVVHDPPKMSLDYAFWSLKKRSLGFQDFLNFFNNLFRQAYREENTTKNLLKICRFLKNPSIKIVTVAEGARIFDEE